MKTKKTREFKPWMLEFLTVSGIDNIPTATVRLVRDKKTIQDAGTGEDSMDAMYKAIDRLTGQPGKPVYRSFSFNGAAVCEASVSVNFGGKPSFAGRAVDADILRAGTLAYLDALNQYLQTMEEIKKRKKGCDPL